ncbi:hypothetical protein AG1IA_07438 [Rhizoctonia solani AG-1 IA]|uniref:Uncharacterized protein n=1 Tax=Thanatephorus cucumeris (strain AG1-IA) TaxID=983506 RepID=L8WK10_THACA|nr:hypothetical protein AG1IA_07438 [Rhizoctonia solani AG-1 IA]
MYGAVGSRACSVTYEKFLPVLRASLASWGLGGLFSLTVPLPSTARLH